MSDQKRALIGYTGFVGSNILNQQLFEYLYNSKNIEEIQKKDFDLVVCAGASSIKWLANKEPEKDLAAIERLIKNLKSVKAKKFVLISTIDVYPEVNAVNEDSLIVKENLSTYGKNRRYLEEFIADNFDSLIVRLPGLFGRGLKKNPFYDLMQGSFKYINPDSVLQFYNLDKIWLDIGLALANNLKLVNFATEPISLQEVAKEVFNMEIIKETTEAPVFYDMRTKHGSLWENSEFYLYLKDRVLTDMKIFVNQVKEALVETNKQ